MNVLEVVHVLFFSTGNDSDIDYPGAESDLQYDAPDYYIPDMTPLLGYVDEKQIKQFLNEWRMMRYNNMPDQQVKAWFDNLLQLHTPHITGYEQCLKQYTYYMADDNALPGQGALHECGMQDCFK